MKMIVTTHFRVLFLAAALAAAACVGTASQDLDTLRDAVYDNHDPAAVEAIATMLDKDLNRAAADPLRQALVRSSIDYYVGRAWNEAGDRKKAVARFESALAAARESMRQGEHAQGIYAAARALSELSRLKDIVFLVANGPKVLSYAEKILSLEPGHAGAALILASAKAYPPAVFGGNPREALLMLQTLLAPRTQALEKDELFDLRTCMGVALAKLGRKDEAAAWFEGALVLYPGNRFARESLEDLNR